MFSIDEHVRRDGTTQRHKYTCNFQCPTLDKLTSDPRQFFILFDQDARDGKHNLQTFGEKHNFETKLSRS